MTPDEWQRVRPILESALEMDSAKRPAFLNETCADPSVRREIESLIAAHEQAGTGMLNGAHHSFVAEDVACFRFLPGKRIGVYEILEEIAQGGMGAVYRAIRADGQYKQHVALKIVRADLGAEITAARFRNERQILASLDHANIAKILDGGATADGLPYFVMELIDGLPITEYCDRNRLSIDARLKIFRTVCSAVHYAHQHLVIHRDIKPTNILITPDGFPKLLDFGIAKILDPTLLPENVTVTAAGLWMMTPEYASPEQLRGEAITTSTDVYSLGLVLYELLAGHSAHRFSSHMPHEVARAVLETDPEKPSTAIQRRKKAGAEKQEKTALTPALVSGLRADSPEKLRRRLEGDLDNIVLKAIRKEPRERYNSADQLSEDLRRHLESLPVLARKSTFAYRCRKYVLRHKAGVAAAALVSFSLLIGMTVTLREARIARSNQLRAEQRFNDLRKLSNSLIFEIHDSVQDLPGSTAARKLIIERALQYLDALAHESRDDPSLQRELGAAYKRIADVQGYIFGANLGDTAAALDSYKKALEVRQTLAKSRFATPADVLALAEAYRTVSATLLTQGETDAALEDSKLAVEAAEEADRVDPNDPARLTELLLDYQLEGNILGGDMSLSSLGNNAAALIFRRKQLETAERLAATQSADAAARGAVGISLTMMGDQLFVTGEKNAALSYYTRAQGILEDAAAHSQGPRPPRVLDLFYERMALMQLANRQLKEAAATIQRALQISRKLSHEDPKDADMLDALATDEALTAESLARQNRKSQATTMAAEAIGTAKQVMLLDPKDAEFRNAAATAFIAAGNTTKRFGDNPGALKYYREASDVFSEVLSTNQHNAEARVRLAASYNEIGGVLLRMRNVGDAVESFRKALLLLDPKTAEVRLNGPELYTAADSYAGLGQTETFFAAQGHTATEQISHWREASSWYERSLEVWSKVKEPGAIRPDGFDCIPPAVVARQLARSQQALQRLKEKEE